MNPCKECGMPLKTWKKDTCHMCLCELEQQATQGWCRAEGQCPDCRYADWNQPS